MNTNKLIFWIGVAVSTLANIGTSVWMLIHADQLTGSAFVWDLIVTMFLISSACMITVLKPNLSNNYTIKIIDRRPRLVKRKAMLLPDPYCKRHLFYGIILVLLSVMWMLLQYPMMHQLTYLVVLVGTPLILIILGLIIYTEKQIKNNQ